MMIHPRIRHRAALTFIAALAAVCLAACGSSTASSSASGSPSAAVSSPAHTSGTSVARSKLVACLKAHGVTLPARPPGARRPRSDSGGPGFFGGGGGPRRGFATNPKLRAAFRACGGRRFGGRRLALSHAAITKFAACVKQRGYTLPAPNFSGKGPIFPAQIERNRRFQAAARACRTDLRPPGAPPPGGTGTTTSAAPPTPGA